MKQLFILEIIFNIQFLFTLASTSANSDNFELSIIHINDFHARFEETNEASLPCRPQATCVGGYARMATVVKDLQRTRTNPIFLNAADNFQGTIWYSLFRYNVTSRFLNMLPADAMTLGNHEFAHDVGGLEPLLKQLTSPVIVANIDAASEPSLEGLFRKSVVVTRSGRKIGIIGAILKETSQMALTGRLRFTDELEAIRAEAQNLRSQGVNIIIALTHCGVICDTAIANKAGDLVDIVVGGHSHTFLYSSHNGTYPGNDKNPAGPYPIEVDVKGRKVLIVQAFAFARYVGNLTVTFDVLGNIKSYSGNPVYLGSEIEKDPEILREIDRWRSELDIVTKRPIGYTNVDLLNEPCWAGECPVGSFTVDGFVNETARVFKDLDIRGGFIHAGGMRSNFMTGPISYGDIMTFLPFAMTFDYLELDGQTLREVFEHSVSRPWQTVIGAAFLQVSGFQVTFDMIQAVGSRVTSLKIRNGSGFEDLVDENIYGLIVASFLANGGDGYAMISRNRKNHRIGLLDIDIMPQ